MVRIGIGMILLGVFVSCSSGDDLDDLFNGQASALKNGTDFEARVRFEESIMSPGLFILQMDVFNAQGFLRESFRVANFTNTFSRQEIVSNGFDGLVGLPRANYVTVTEDGDVVGDRYDELDLGNTNYITLTSYNSRNQEIEGEFNISVILTRDNGEGEIPADTLRFTQGKFVAKARPELFE